MNDVTILFMTEEGLKDNTKSVKDAKEFLIEQVTKGKFVYINKLPRNENEITETLLEEAEDITVFNEINGA